MTLDKLTETEHFSKAFMFCLDWQKYSSIGEKNLSVILKKEFKKEYNLLVMPELKQYLNSLIENYKPVK